MMSREGRITYGEYDSGVCVCVCGLTATETVWVRGRYPLHVKISEPERMAIREEVCTISAGGGCC